MTIFKVHDGSDFVEIGGGTVDMNNHVSNDGTDHSDVVLNNTHRGSDGSDHSLLTATAGTVSASKALIADASKDIDFGVGNIMASTYEATFGFISVTGPPTTAGGGSDARLVLSGGTTYVLTRDTSSYDGKENWRPLRNSEFIYQLVPMEFQGKGEADRSFRASVMAEDVHKVAPEWTIPKRDEVGDLMQGKVDSVKKDFIYMAMLAEIKKLNQRILTLENRVDPL